MEYNNIKSELKAMIVETLHLDIEPEDIDDTQSFELGLDLDSLAVITFIVAIEYVVLILIWVDLNYWQGIQTPRSNVTMV